MSRNPPADPWAQYIRARANNKRKAIGRVRSTSVEIVAAVLREKFGADPKDTTEQAIADELVAREETETGSEDFEAVNHHGGHDLAELTPAQLLEYANDGTLPPPSTRGKK